MFPVNSSTLFWNSETSVDIPSAFQISLTAPSHVSLSSLAFSSLAIAFSNDERPLVVKHSDEPEASGSVRVIEVGTVSSSSDAPNSRESKGNLRWSTGTVVVISGTIVSAVPTTLTVSESLPW